MDGDNTRVLFLSHGGGPLPLLGDPGHRAMVETLESIAARIPRPSAILVVSAHWEEALPTITATPTPELIYDYAGFPEESYRIQYPVPGEPGLAHPAGFLHLSGGRNLSQAGATYHSTRRRRRSP